MWRKATVIGLLLLLGALWLWMRPRAPRSKSEEGGAGMPVTRGTVELTIAADGVLKPRTTVEVKSYAAGRVDLLAVEVGDIVKQGDLIAKIDPTDSLAAYDQAVADLAAAQARLRQAQVQAGAQPKLTAAAIAQAEASYQAALRDLARLEQADHPQERARVEAALEKARANLTLAETDLERTSELRARGFVAQSDLDSAINRRDLARAELASAQRQWDTLDQQLGAELEAARARVAEAKASLDRARADAVQDEVKRADVTTAQAQVERAQAAVTNAKTTLNYTTITAPRDGVILAKLVEEGTIVTSGRSLVSQGADIVLLGDLSEMLVEVNLDEADVGMVKPGLATTITVDAFPEDKFRGRVLRIDPRATTQQNVTTVLVTVRVDNPDSRLRPGMTATCEFPIARAENVLCVPSLAVQRAEGQHLLYVRRGKDIVPVPVEIGLVGDRLTEIRSGVTEGTEVVLPLAAAPAGAGESRGREMGRRMGGAGGFLRQP